MHVCFRAGVMLLSAFALVLIDQSHSSGAVVANDANFEIFTSTATEGGDDLVGVNNPPGFGPFATQSTGWQLHGMGTVRDLSDFGTVFGTVTPSGKIGLVEVLRPSDDGSLPQSLAFESGNMELSDSINAVQTTGFVPGIFGQVNGLDGVDEPFGGASALTRQFTGRAGAAFSFKYNFLTNEPGGNDQNDVAFIMIANLDDPLSSQGALEIASVDGTDLDTHPTIGTTRQSGWQDFTIPSLPGVAGESTSYLVIVGVTHQRDPDVTGALPSNNSILLLDDFDSPGFSSGSPEPSSVFLLLTGLLGFGLKRKHCVRN